MNREDYKQGYMDAMYQLLADIRMGCDTPEEEQDEMFWADMSRVEEVINKRLDQLM